MGGDHKCPVCQATFTRPQHVARHMRSHTGDRPYKCQCCGDQFARSDLLSRHINKCHANEKPLLTGTGARRKGSASASRATTSKQVCDQCVQGSLPCDGCNPCSKCMQRKTRCTFVKFHRQTAPVGPGHNLQSNAVTSLASSLGMPPPIHQSASSSSTLSASGLAGPSALAPNSLLDLELEGHPSHSHRMPPLFSTHALDRRSYDDDFLLGHSGQQHHGGPTAVTSMAEALGYGGAPGFGYPPAGGLYGHAGASGSAPGAAGGGGVQHTPSPEHFANSGSSVGSWDDHHSTASGTSAAGRRTMHSSATTATATGASSGGEYVLGPTRDMGYGVPRSAQGGMGIGHHVHAGGHPGHGHGHAHAQPHQSGLHHDASYAAGIDLNMDLLPPGGGAPPPSTTLTAFPVAVQAPSYILNAQLAQSRQQQQPPSQQSHGQPAFSRYDMNQSRYPPSNASNSTNNSRRGSVDLYTDGSSDAGHASSASGRGSVDRLFDSSYHLSGSLPDRPSTASTTSSSSEQSSQHSEPFPSFSALERSGFDDRAEFSSSFGLMSLDDPDVTAGIATDGRPFFSHPDQAHNKMHLENGGDMTTPMPAAPGKRDSASMIQFPSGIPDVLSSDKEGDSKEDLREVWKQYMRTPLSGPDATTPGATLGLLGGGTPRRQRVSSLPIRTPSLQEPYPMLGGMLPPPPLAFPVGGAPLQQYSQQHQMYLAHNIKGRPSQASGMRTTLQGVPVNASGAAQSDRERKEDLKSYEAAVLARQTPLNLNLDLHKRARARGTSTSTTGSGHGASHAGPQGQRVMFAPDVQTHDRDSSSPSNLSRSPSAGGGSESPRPSSGSGGSDQVDFPSMNSYGDSEDIDSPTGTSARPNFKRLPSQTLGPAHAKRVYLGYDRDDEEGTGIPISGQLSSNTNTQSYTSQGQQNQYQPDDTNHAAMSMMSHPDRVVVNLAERRRRRMSAPAPSNGLFGPPGTMRLDSVPPSGP